MRCSKQISFSSLICLIAMKSTFEQRDKKSCDNKIVKEKNHTHTILIQLDLKFETQNSNNIWFSLVFRFFFLIYCNKFMSFHFMIAFNNFVSISGLYIALLV